MKKRKPLKPSFVVTVAAGTAALATAGCFGEIITNPPPADCPDAESCDPPLLRCPISPPAEGADCGPGEGSCSYKDECGQTNLIASCGEGGWELEYTGGTCNPPPVECPETAPKQGGACQPGYGSCTYVDECGQVYLTATCGGAGWEVEHGGVSCNPPAIECPETVPSHGASCDGWGYCEYSDECGSPVTATCGDYTWEVKYEGTCNPPPPCEYLGQEACGYDPACVWHTPGCGDPGSIPALPQAGCFSVTPCETDADCPIGTCQQVMVTPDCVDEGCDACGMAVDLCVQ